MTTFNSPPLGKMAVIFKCIFMNEKFGVVIQI